MQKHKNTQIRNSMRCLGVYKGTLYYLAPAYVLERYIKQNIYPIVLISKYETTVIQKLMISATFFCIIVFKTKKYRDFQGNTHGNQSEIDSK